VGATIQSYNESEETMSRSLLTLSLLLLVTVVGIARSVLAGNPVVQGHEGEMNIARAWSAAMGFAQSTLSGRSGEKWLAHLPNRPFSFTYGSQTSTELLPHWQFEQVSSRSESATVERVIRFTDPKTGLRMTITATLYEDFPAVEWTLHFTNTGLSDSAILEDILPLNATLPGPASGSSPVLHYAKGALCSIDDFAPLEKAMKPGVRVDLAPGGGRSSSEFLPFFNLDGGGEGIVVAVGWTGQWQATFGRDMQGHLTAQAGMATTRLKLHPGEEIRTPKVLTLFWQGDRMRGNNLLRRFLLAHHRPRSSGKPLVMPVSVSKLGGHLGRRPPKDDPRDHPLRRARRALLDRCRVVRPWPLGK
jgi:alpha-galactosidase